MTKKKINEKIDELNEQVEWFYGEDFKLEDASEKYKSAIKLAREIETDLTNLKNEIKVIEEDFSRE
jgi:exonuclease VII small subunit